MDLTKKRKVEDNGTDASPSPTASPTSLTSEDARKILQSLNQDQLLDIVQAAIVNHPDVLESVRTIADRDVSLRKLFIRGLSAETTTESVRSIFSVFGPIDEAIVIFDKTTGKSKGYGFVTFTHVDGAVLALKEPSKKIDGRVTVTQLASAGLSTNSGSSDISLRKIYVGNVPYDMPGEKLLQHFTIYGEIEEGPLGFDRVTGKSKGFAFFLYKSEEGAKASLLEPVKNIDGHQIVCKFAVDNKKVKPQGQASSGVTGNGAPPSQPQPPSMSGSYGGSQYGAPGGMYQQGPAGYPSSNYGYNSSMPQSGPGYPSSGGYGTGISATYGVPQYGAQGGSNEYGGNVGSSMYRMQPVSAGMPSGNYGLATQNQQPSPMPRGPPGGMYPGAPPYY